ncbi:hypothetical protein C1T26_07995 [Bacillus amyloliquefaciens]|nr:hypothetical protein C1T26_07995 [Bacillus amyloliquefaciens]
MLKREGCVEVNINKKSLKMLTIILIISICYVLLLNPEVILEEECPKMQKKPECQIRLFAHFPFFFRFSFSAR